VTFVLDQLEALNTNDNLFKGRLNLDKIGVFGHSLGGSVATRACQLDNRLKAGLDMDAPLFGSVPAEGLTQPFMFMSREKATFQRELAHVPPKTAQEIIDKEYSTMQAALNNSRAPGYYLTLTGLFHYDFTDLSLWSPLTPLLGVTGPISAARAHQIIDAYTLAFFDTYLEGKSSVLLAGNTADFPEVNLTVYRPGTA
jgi:predicted dienelactone hydrolase